MLNTYSGSGNKKRNCVWKSPVSGYFSIWQILTKVHTFWKMHVICQKAIFDAQLITDKENFMTEFFQTRNFPAKETYMQKYFQTMKLIFHMLTR